MIQRQRYRVSLSFLGEKSFFLIQIWFSLFLGFEVGGCATSALHWRGRVGYDCSARFYGAAVKERWESMGRRISSLMIGTVSR